MSGKKIGLVLIAIPIFLVAATLLRRWTVQFTAMPASQVSPLVSRAPMLVPDDDAWEGEVEQFERWRVRSKEEAVTFYVLNDERSNEQIARHGILVTRPGAKATIVIMHGYTSGKTDMGGLRLLFTKYNLFLFDFRAHGEDVEGQASTFGYNEVYDVFAAVDFLKTRPETKELPLIGYGFSMGAATTIEAQARDPKLFDALILDCPFDSSDNIIRRGLDRVLGRIQVPFFEYTFQMPGKEWLQKYAFHPYVQPILFFLLRVFAGMDATRVPTTPMPIKPIESVRSITVPLLFIACYADDRVPADAIAGIYANAAGYKRLWVTKGVRHYGSVFNNPELYQHVVSHFIERVLNKKYLTEPQARVMMEMPRSELLRMHDKLYTHPISPALLMLLYPPKDIDLKK